MVEEQAPAFKDNLLGLRPDFSSAGPKAVMVRKAMLMYILGYCQASSKGNCLAQSGWKNQVWLDSSTKKMRNSEEPNFIFSYLTLPPARSRDMADTHMTTKVHGAQGVIGYNFSDPLLLWEALQAAGSPVHTIGNRRLLDGNKRLAIVGDRVLELALAESWYGGTEARGRFSQIRTEVGSNANLNGVCHGTGLAAFINKNQASWRVVSPATGSATVEAILAAVFLDSGSMDAVKQVMNTLGLVPT